MKKLVYSHFYPLGRHDMTYTKESFYVKDSENTFENLAWDIDTSFTGDVLEVTTWRHESIKKINPLSPVEVVEIALAELEKIKKVNIFYSKSHL